MSLPAPQISLDAAQIKAIGNSLLQQARQLQQLLRSLQTADRYDATTPHDIRKLTRKCAAGWQLLHHAHAVKRGRHVLRFWRTIRHHLGKLRDADIRLELFHACFPQPNAQQQQLQGHLEQSWLVQYQQARSVFEDDVTQGKALLVTLKKVLMSQSLSFRWNRKSQRWLNREFTQWQDQAAQSLAHPESLHPFRISTKKLRYCLQYLEHESSQLAVLEPLQEQLGLYHDALNALAWIDEMQQLYAHRPATKRVLWKDLQHWRSHCHRLQRAAHARIKQQLRRIVKASG